MTTTRLRPVPAADVPTRTPAVRRPRDVARLGAQSRAMRTAVARWALRSGRCCDFDALTVVLACADERDGPTNFTEEDVWRLWWIELAQWCEHRRLPVPQGLGGALRLVFDHLDETDGFGPGSDPIDDLIDAMEGAGALWRSDRVPSGAG